MTLSTHVLDIDAGRPVAGLRVWTAGPGGAWHEGTTDANGRIAELVGPEAWCAGRWRIVFETAEHAPFFQQIVSDIQVDDATHHHVPLLLAKHGYSVYRGS